MWNCIYKVKWPSEASFSATMPSKATAGKEAALKALHWLHAQGKLTQTGAPLLYDKNEIKEMTRVPVEVTVDASSCQDIDMLIDSYKKDIEPVLNEMEITNLRYYSDTCLEGLRKNHEKPQDSIVALGVEI
jgi:hypothetical protein